MAYIYTSGTRWRKFTGEGDVRDYRAPKGWEARAELCDWHPLTGKKFRTAQWWICERFVGGQR